MVITFLCNIFRSYIISESENIVRIEAGGKNERKERIFPSSNFCLIVRDLCWQGSVRLWSIKKSSVPKYFLETTIHFCHKRINWWTKPNLFYNFFICNVSEKSFSKLEFLIIWPWHGKSREGGSIGFSGNWNANFWSLENVCSLYVRYMYAYQVHTVTCNKTVEENKITHSVHCGWPGGLGIPQKSKLEQWLP